MALRNSRAAEKADEGASGGKSDGYRSSEPSILQVVIVSYVFQPPERHVRRLTALRRNCAGCHPSLRWTQTTVAGRSAIQGRHVCLCSSCAKVTSSTWPYPESASKFFRSSTATLKERPFRFALRSFQCPVCRGRVAARSLLWRFLGCA